MVRAKSRDLIGEWIEGGGERPEHKTDGSQLKIRDTIRRIYRTARYQYHHVDPYLLVAVVDMMPVVLSPPGLYPR